MVVVGAALGASLCVPLSQNETQGLQNRRTYTPTTADDADMLQVSNQNYTKTHINTYIQII